jgi:hypothetical protein
MDTIDELSELLKIAEHPPLKTFKTKQFFSGLLHRKPIERQLLEFFQKTQELCTLL